MQAGKPHRRDSTGAGGRAAASGIENGGQAGALHARSHGPQSLDCHSGACGSLVGISALCTWCLRVCIVRYTIALEKCLFDATVTSYALHSLTQVKDIFIFILRN